MVWRFYVFLLAKYVMWNLLVYFGFSLPFFIAFVIEIGIVPSLMTVGQLGLGEASGLLCNLQLRAWSVVRSDRVSLFFLHSSVENLQGWALPNLSGQPVLMLCHPCSTQLYTQGEKLLLQAIWRFLVSFYAYCLLCFHHVPQWRTFLVSPARSPWSWARVALSASPHPRCSGPF